MSEVNKASFNISIGAHISDQSSGSGFSAKFIILFIQLSQRYGIDVPDGIPGYQLIEEMGRKRGYLLARGEVNSERMAKVLLDEYRLGKLGYFTLEMPEEKYE